MGLHTRQIAKEWVLTMRLDELDSFMDYTRGVAVFVWLAEHETIISPMMTVYWRVPSLGRVSESPITSIS